MLTGLQNGPESKYTIVLHENTRFLFTLQQLLLSGEMGGREAVLASVCPCHCQVWTLNINNGIISATGASEALLSNI